MKHTKKNNLKVAEPKRKLARGVIQRPVRAQTGTRQSAKGVSWDNELEELSSRRFESVDDAITEIVEKVVNRMKLKGADRTETIEFLTLMFQTDEQLRQDIGSSLKIG